jgi:hypothetical protein
MPQRYVMIPPVPGMDVWWYIKDTEQDDQIMAVFFEDMPNAAKEVRDLHSRLNKQAKAEKK